MKKLKDFIEESASGRLMTMLKSKQLIKNPPKIPTPQERKAEQEKDKKTNEAVVISHKGPIGIRVADIGPGNKEYNVKTDKNYDSLSSLLKKKQDMKVKKAMKEAKEKTEYDYEGDMARGQLQSIINNAQRVHDMLKDNDNLPEWVQSKITLAEDYISTVSNYLMSELDESDIYSIKNSDKTYYVSKYPITSNHSTYKKIKAEDPKAQIHKNGQPVKEEVESNVTESDAAYGAALKAREEKRKMSNISSSDRNKLMKISVMMQKERDKKNMKKEEIESNVTEASKTSDSEMAKPQLTFQQALSINKKDKDERETKRKAQDKESMASIKARIARAKAMKEAK